MKKIFLFLLLIISFVSYGQTYNPANFTVSNKSYGVAQAVPTDARSQFYDATNFVMRDYQSTTEVNSYLNLAKYRTGHFLIYIHNGGSLSSGVWTGGTTDIYIYKDGVLDANLVPLFTNTTLSNTGSGFRIVKPISGSDYPLRSLASSNTIIWDSTSNSNSLTGKVDTSLIVTINRLSDTAASIRLAISAGGGGITTLTGDVTASGTGTVAATIANNAVSNAKFRQSAALSVVGRTSNSTGNVADIAAATSGHVLRRNGTTLDFGTIDSVSVPLLHSEAYYNTKYPTIGSDSVYIKAATNTGTSIFFIDADTLKLKRLQAGSNVTLTSNADSSITIAASGGGGSPAGSSTELQYRNGGSFGAMAGTTWDNTNRKLTLDRGSSDSAGIIFDGSFTGSKPFVMIRPPVKNDSSPVWHWLTQESLNDDGSYTNHVLKLKPFAKDKNTYYGIGDEWEGRWRTGGATYFERHIQFNHFYNNENARLLSFTTISRDSMGNSQSQLDLRGNTFLYSDLKNNNFFSISKSGNYTGVSTVAELIGLNPYYKITDETAPSNNYTLFQQVGPDITFSTYRNYSFASRQASKTFAINDMQLTGASVALSTSVNWGSSGILTVNPSHASTGVARFQQNSVDALWILNNRRILVNTSTDNTIGQLQVNGKVTIATVDSAAVPSDGSFLFKDPSTGEIKRAVPPGGGGGITGSLTSGRVPVASGTTTLSNGLMRDNGSGVAIGGSVVSGNMLDVQGGNSRFDMYDAGSKYGELTIETPTGTSDLRVRLRRTASTGLTKWVFTTDNTNADRYWLSIDNGTGEVSNEFSAGGWFPTWKISGSEKMRLNSGGELQIGSATDNGAFTLQNTGDFINVGKMVLRNTSGEATPNGGLVFDGTFTGGTEAAHAIVNQRIYSRTTGAAAFIDDGGSSTVSADHTISFQSRPSHTGGTLTTMHGAGVYPTVSSTGTATNIWNYTARSAVNNGTTTENVAYNVESPTLAGSGAITNSYGLKVANLTNATNNYSIFTGTAQSYFGGTVRVPSGELILNDLSGTNNVPFTLGNTANNTYPSINYNAGLRANSGKFLVSDIALKMDMNATGFVFRGSNTGTAGGTITFTDLLTVPIGNAATMGNMILHNGQFQVNTNTPAYFGAKSSSDYPEVTYNYDLRGNAYKITDEAYRLRLDNGFKFFVAGSGTAGTAPTFAEISRLTDAGEFFLGSLTDNGAFTLQNTGGLYQQGSFRLGGVRTATSNDVNLLVKGESDSTVAQLNFPIVQSTYSVTLTNTTNIASSSTNTTYYERRGNVVHVWGTFTAAATAGGSVCELGFSIPVASGFTNVFDLGGSGSSDTVPVKIIADATNDRAKFRFTPANTSSTEYSFHFTYWYIAP